MKALDSYLNDHLAGSIAALELLDRLIEVSEGSTREQFFRELRSEIDADHKTLRDIMDLVSANESTVRKAGAWLMEKFSRSKIQLKESDVGGPEVNHGLFLALETLGLGITGKRLLWRALSAAAVNVPQLIGPDYCRLESRAIEQGDRVEAERLKVCQVILAENLVRD